MEKRTPVRYFTLADHEAGLCDKNGIAYPGGAKIIKPAEVAIIGEAPCQENEPKSQSETQQEKKPEEREVPKPIKNVNLEPAPPGPTQRIPTKRRQPRESPDGLTPDTD